MARLWVSIWYEMKNRHRNAQRHAGSKWKKVCGGSSDQPTSQHPPDSSSGTKERETKSKKNKIISLFLHLFQFPPFPSLTSVPMLFNRVGVSAYILLDDDELLLIGCQLPLLLLSLRAEHLIAGLCRSEALVSLDLGLNMNQAHTHTHIHTHIHTRIHNRGYKCKE